MEKKINNLCPQTIFTVAHTYVGGMPFNNHGRTLRLVVPCNVAARGLQVHFANHEGTETLPVGASSLALCSEDGVLLPDTLIPLTVGGRLSFELGPGAQLLSDVTSFNIKPGDYFALNIYYPSQQRVDSGNWVGRSGLRSRTGNFSADLELPGPSIVSRFARTVITTDMTVHLTSVAGIIAYSDTPGKVLACFGDSVTQQANWTAPLEKLLHHKYPGQISLCNLGISGNRLLADAAPGTKGLAGIAGVRRFERDLLAVKGLTHAVLALGANDVGLPGSEGVPEDATPATADYTAALRHLADELHKLDVFVIAATITPRWIIPPFTPEREIIRQRWNEWIRTAPCFDAVFDFDRVLRRSDGKYGMQDKCHLPDGLHPSPYGGVLMAKSIDLSLFGENAHA